MFILILSTISLALSYNLFDIPFFYCSKIIFCDILSLLLLMIYRLALELSSQFSLFLAIYLSPLAIQLKVLLLADVTFFLSIDFVFSLLYCLRLVFWYFPLRFKPIQLLNYETCLKEFDFYFELFLSYILFWLYSIYLSYYQFLLCTLSVYLLCLALFLSNNMYSICFFNLSSLLFLLFVVLDSPF